VGEWADPKVDAGSERERERSCAGPVDVLKRITKRCDSEQSEKWTVNRGKARQSGEYEDVVVGV
jgi:hypothetical protein